MKKKKKTPITCILQKTFIYMHSHTLRKYYKIGNKVDTVKILKEKKSFFQIALILF